MNGGSFARRPSRAEVSRLIVDFYRVLCNWFAGRRRLRVLGRGIFTQRNARRQSRVRSCLRWSTTYCFSFLLSAEYALPQPEQHGDYVSDLYYAFLCHGQRSRGPEIRDQLPGDPVDTRETMRTEFIGSLEFATRIDAMIAQGR